MKKLLTFLSIVIGSLCVYGSAFADSVPTITGYRSYSVNMNSVSSDGINGGNPNGIIPFTIIGAPPAGSTVIYLNGLNWQFTANYGNAQNQYNKATVSFLFVQQAENSQMPKTFTTNVPVISSVRTNKGNIVQGTCYFPNQDANSIVVQCDYVTEDYSSFTEFYFTWGSSSVQTQLAQIGSMPNIYNTHPISLSIGDIQIISTADPLIAGQNQIISQNQTIINQNQQMITGMEVNNQLQQQTYDYLTDATPPSANTEVLGNAVGWLPPGPVDSILTLPLQLLQGIINVFTGSASCTPLNFPVPFVNYNLQLPCVNILMDEIGFTPIWSIVGGVISAIIIWQTLKWLYEYVDKTLTFRENNSGLWGGL